MTIESRLKACHPKKPLTKTGFEIGDYVLNSLMNYNRSFCFVLSKDSYQLLGDERFSNMVNILFSDEFSRKDLVDYIKKVIKDEKQVDFLKTLEDALVTVGRKRYPRSFETFDLMSDLEQVADDEVDNFKHAMAYTINGIEHDSCSSEPELSGKTENEKKG